jgi:cyclic beta-1,2-glucan synthetase
MIAEKTASANMRRDFRKRDSGYALIEDLAHRSILVSRRQHDRERADFWANRLLSAARRSPDRVPFIFSEITSSNPALEPHFIIRLMNQLSEEEDVFSAEQKWLEGKLGLPLQETIRSEHARQSRKQVSIANDVTSLRRLAQLDWREMFESVSLVEAFLEQDVVYSASDFGTRDRCRKAVEEIARYSKTPEIEVARRAIQLSHEVQAGLHGNVTYFLIGEGKKRLEAHFPCRWPLSKSLLRWVLDHPAFVYFGGIACFSAAILAVALWAAATSGAGFWALLGLGIAAFLPASESSIQVFNYLLSPLIPPRLIPCTSFKDGIPDDFRTLVAFPTMLLTRASVSEEINKLEVRYLANPDPNLLFALLTDFSDASAPAMPEDQELFEIVRNGIADLNARHGDGRFYLFHRDRTWCETENCWTGWERKRGKLEDLNRYLCGEMREGTGEFLRVGNRDSLKKVRFVITLDSDTELPHDSAIHLVEAMAHPLNRAVICHDRRIVCEGYGVIQPRVLTSLPASTTSRFGSIFSNARGTDPYAQAVSDLYQDLFGNGAFIGKAIYDVRAFHQVLSGRFPDQALLSHDLIEGNYLRVGFDSTIVLLEQFPSNYQSFSRRQHRWIRGDWQIWNWLFLSVPGREGKRERNPLFAIDRWKIFDNLRRSLVPPAIISVLVGSWLIMPDSLSWNVFIALALLLPALIPIPGRLRLGIIGQSTVWREQGKEILRVVASAALIPYQAWISLDAIARVFYRRTVSRRKLLEWETAQAVHWRSLDHESELRRLSALLSAGTAVLAAILFYRDFSVWPEREKYSMVHDGLITEISDLRRLCKKGAGMGELWQCFQSIADISAQLKTGLLEFS